MECGTRPHLCTDNAAMIASTGISATVQACAAALFECCLISGWKRLGVSAMEIDLVLPPGAGLLRLRGRQQW